MRVDIVARVGMRKVNLSLDPDGPKTVADLLRNPNTAAEIGAPEGAAIRVNGGQIDPAVYALKPGDEVVFEKRADDKS